MSKFFINIMGNNFAEVQLSGEILNFHVSMHKAYPKICTTHLAKMVIIK